MIDLDLLELKYNINKKVPAVYHKSYDDDELFEDEFDPYVFSHFSEHHSQFRLTVIEEAYALNYNPYGPEVYSYILRRFPISTLLVINSYEKEQVEKYYEYDHQLFDYIERIFILCSKGYLRGNICTLPSNERIYNVINPFWIDIPQISDYLKIPLKYLKSQYF